MMLGLSRNAVFAVLGLLLIWSLYLGSSVDTGITRSYFGFSSNKSPLSPHVHSYFDQAFSTERAPDHDLSGLRAACARAEWKEENNNVYLKCGGMCKSYCLPIINKYFDAASLRSSDFSLLRNLLTFELLAAGMTSIISQVKVCFKLAVDAGVHLLLPAMPLRDSGDLTNFNFWNESAYHTYDEWFDQEHLLSSMAKACPQMKIRHPDEAGTPSLPVAHRWDVDFSKNPDFRHVSGYFWVGRPFKAWFDYELRRLRFVDFNTPKSDAVEGQGGNPSPGHGEEATIIGIASQFLLFRITDDATGRELALWNDLSHLIRFKEEPRLIANRVLSHINRPFYGVHFRAEKDQIWSPIENQLKVDLDALDKAWEQYGSAGKERPLVYLACGDQTQVEKFASAASQRGWTVTSKYDLLKEYPVASKKLMDLPFDFQGAVDMGVMLKSHFFFGITGSAFSCTVANLRDSTGRYRGSSLVYPDDGNARTHLFNDGDATHYPCCL